MIKAGVIVLADRYAFTAFGGCARGWTLAGAQSFPSFAMQPDIAFFFRVPLDGAVQRITSARAQLKFYEAGRDPQLSESRVGNFKLLQKRILYEYEKKVDDISLTVIGWHFHRPGAAAPVVRSSNKRWMDDGLADP